MDIDAFIRETEARRKAIEILGTADERRKLRERLGLSLRDVAAATGLHVSSIARREGSDWKMKRDSLESPGAIAYIRWVAAARGIQL
jgi:transcriptional regulator with XRE-family HTH domain